MSTLLKISDATKSPVHFYLNLFSVTHFEKKRTTLNLPEKFHEEINFSKESTTTQWASYSEGYLRTHGFFVFKENLPPFELHEALRKALPMDALKKGTTQIDVSTLTSAESSFFLNAIGNLFSITDYKPTAFGKKNSAAQTTEKKSKDETLNIILKSKGSLRENENNFRTGYAEGKAINFVRELSDLPGNELRPLHYLQRLKGIAKDLKITLTFHDQKSLEKMGAGAFLAVVSANPSEPYGIAKLHHKPKNAKRKIALVGKGLCFDTGGYNIKTGDSMNGMHRDMNGSAVALALTKHLIEEHTDLEIETYLAIAENLISPSAYRPNDVVVASNGLSIEVVDTDAEGRMVLSDTLVLASKSKPDLIIDFATLTGAVMRALGTARSGVFSNHPRLMDATVKAGTECGERVWGFPIGEDYLSALESEIADIKQCGPGNFADHIYAATFLSQFVEKSVPWVHVDLASAENKGGLGLSAREVTGFGVRLGKKIIQNFLK
jgi:leucyl aminopeptidase